MLVLPRPGSVCRSGNLRRRVTRTDAAQRRDRDGLVAERAGAVGGVAGLVFTSTTGASSTVMPIALSCWPVARDMSYESTGENVAPMAMLPGETASGAPIRVTLPPS